MTTLIAVENVSLDGVMQAPGSPDEDRRGGFDQGGWFVPYSDAGVGAAMAERMQGDDGAILLGRRTWEQFAGFWPKQKDNPFTARLNATTKYVATRSSDLPDLWENSVPVGPDAVAGVRRIKDTVSGVLTVIGSADLLQSLIRADLVDEFVLLITPLVLGEGRQLFSPGLRARLALADCTPTGSGVIIATYRRAA